MAFQSKLNSHARQAYATCLIRLMETPNIRINTENALIVYRSIRWYPVGMVVLWSPILVVSLYQLSGGHVTDIVVESTEIVDTQYGTVLATIFFIFNTTARSKWMQLIRKVIGSTHNDPRSQESEEYLSNCEKVPEALNFLYQFARGA